MKILSIRFKNLNSLYGEWSLDFTTPEYTNNGIFAITGPTGAGKSTILDAVCLALYGRTPRLKSINKTANEIMSRQTGECFAEVCFSTQTGEFRAHWSQHRARKKADGRLAESKHELSEMASGKVIEASKRKVSDAIIEKTGMDFDRFTRSILLAQGGFAAFLQADANERAPILEQITGTEIYSSISMRVHERQRDEQDKLALLQERIAGITIFTPEDEELLQEELKIKEKETQQLAKRKETLEKAVAWKKGIAILQQELINIQKEEENIEKEDIVFEPQRTILQEALKAAELDGEYATLDATRKQQINDQNNLKLYLEQMPELQKTFEQKENMLTEAALASAKIKDKQRVFKELIKKVRELDILITEKNKAQIAAKKEYDQAFTQLTNSQKRCDKIVIDLKSRQDESFKIDNYLLENSADAALITELTGIEEKLKSLITAAKTKAEKEKTLNSQKDDLPNISAKFDIQAKQVSTCAAKKKEAEDQVAAKQIELIILLKERLLREYRTEYDNLLRERAYIQKIASLESERKHLEDGKPCPLCGAENHPYAEGNIPQPTEIDLKISQLHEIIKETEILQKNIDKLKENTALETTELQKAQNKLEQITLQKKQSAKDIERLELEFKTALNAYNNSLSTIKTMLMSFGIENIDERDLIKIPAKLQKRLDLWQQAIAKKTAIERNTTTMKIEFENLVGTIKNLETAVKDKYDYLEKLNKDLENTENQRIDIFGDKNADHAEQEIESKVKTSENNETTARQERDKYSHKLQTLKTLSESLQDTIDKRSPQITKLETGFLNSCQAAGFSEETSFTKARLSSPERSKLNAQAQDLNRRKADIISRKKDREDKLETETTRDITKEALDILTANLSEISGILDNLKEKLGVVKQKLTANSEAKTKIQDQKILVENQTEEFKRWDKLRTLIGSADGKKFRNFAQGLTFELMVSHANQQLADMSDRYLLQRNHEKPLELNVIDNYQAGEIRSTRNLSGGESFIVSLSLALGLSRMASHKVRVDSLFLDEGFGTLDEDALETALETLAGLQQKGKTIGIISHVAALKNRVGIQIKVSPVSGGKSTITGPGCNKITNQAKSLS